MDLAAEFERYMWDCIHRCKEFGYNAGYWKRMVVDHGAVEASHRLLTGTRASDGFTRLWEEGRLNLSVEFSVLLPKYHDLFTDDERAEARRRLRAVSVRCGRPLGLLDGFRSDTKGSGRRISCRYPGVTVPEALVVVPVSAGDGSGIWPTAAELAKARQTFLSRESRDVFYRAATYLVEQALQGLAPITLSEALAVLLQTWNRAFYQYHPPGPDYLDRIDALLDQHASWRRRIRDRTISTFSSADGAELEIIFRDFEKVLGPVGRPRRCTCLRLVLVGLWGVCHRCGVRTPARLHRHQRQRYVRMANIAKSQSARVGGEDAIGADILKALMNTTTAASPKVDVPARGRQERAIRARPYGLTGPVGGRSEATNA